MYQHVFCVLSALSRIIILTLAATAVLQTHFPNVIVFTYNFDRTIVYVLYLLYVIKYFSLERNEIGEGPSILILTRMAMPAVNNLCDVIFAVLYVVITTVH